jgi:Family of unknown function (DUF5677)
LSTTTVELNNPRVPHPNVAPFATLGWDFEFLAQPQEPRPPSIIYLSSRAWRTTIRSVEPPIFLRQIDERIPGFSRDLQPLMKATEQILAEPAVTDLKKAVQAQVEVATEHFGAMLAAAANGFGLPAEAAARNLFDVAVGTLYLMKKPDLLVDFIEFGQLTFYRLMKDLSPESAQYKQAQARDLARCAAEMKRIEAKFDKRSSWHGRQVRQICKEFEMEQLYKIAYKTTSGITHGSSYPILSRNENLGWAIGFRKQRWEVYLKESPAFGYSILWHLYQDVFRLFQITDTRNLDEMGKVCARLNE